MYADIHSAAFAPIPPSAAAPRDAFATGTWPELLSHLGCLGRVWSETESPALTLAHRETLSGLRVPDPIGHVPGEGSALRLDKTRLDSAWVVQRGHNPGALRELRLYDDDGRAIAVLGSLPTAAGSLPAATRLHPVCKTAPQRPPALITAVDAEDQDAPPITTTRCRVKTGR